MEVDEIQRQVRKFQKISCNGSSINDNSTNPNKLATQKGNLDTRNQTRQFPVEDGGGGGGGVGRLCGWPSSRIVRVSRASGGKDRHSKVLTSKGLRDRRVRLSVTTAIQFYDLQDRLGYDQPSKAVEWLIKAASSSIAELPSLDPSFPGADNYNLIHNHHQSRDKKSTGDDIEFEDPNYQDDHHHSSNNNNNNASLSKSSACSSTSETSKGSGLSLSRSENRIRARERARDMAAKKEKEKESAVVDRVNGVSQSSSFTDLLTGGISSTTVSPNNNSSPTCGTEPRIHWTTPMDYSQLPQFNIAAGDSHPQHHQHFSFLQENFPPVVTTGGGGGSGGGGESYNLNFSIASSSGGGLAPGFNRGTLQSNLVSVLPHQHHLQRFQPSSMVDGSTSTNFPFFIAPTIGSGAPDHFPATSYDSHVLQLYGGEDGGGRHSDQHKGKPKN